MKYCWYDHLAEMQDKPILDGLDILVKIFDAEKISEPSEITINSLSFIHAGDTRGSRMIDWERAISEQSHCYAVFVSSNPDCLVPNADLSRYFSIAQTLTTIANELYNCPEKVQQFMSSVENHVPDWSLLRLDSTSIPESLLAYILAIQYQLYPAHIEYLVAKAEEEYFARLQLLRILLRKAKQSKPGFYSDIDFLPSDFGDESLQNKENTRFRAFCCAIDLLRDDI